MSKKRNVSGVDRRGEWVALGGGGASLLFALLLGILAIWSKSTGASIWAAAAQMLGAVGIWTLSLIQLHQQRLLLEEKIEVEELERLRKEKLGGAQTIFDEEDLSQMDSLAMGRRMRSIQKVLIPVLAIGIAVYHVIAGLLLFPTRIQFGPIKYAIVTDHIQHANVILFFAGGFAFVSFMVSRYALGMSRLPRWTALRGGGNFMFGASAACLAVAIALLCDITGFEDVDRYLSYAIGALMILLAIETVINYIFDFYRPRVEGEEHRPFYDSRVLGMFSEPGGILQSVAKAIDYQFGFKVSETWFYNLLRRQIPYLLLVQALAIMVLTCFLVVPPGHQAVITHYGAVQQETAKPGLHVTWPWPIDSARVIPVERIQRMELGYERTSEDDEAAKSQVMEDRPPVLWTKQHRLQEYKLLVADKATNEDAKVPVNLLSVAMPVQWRVKHNKDADVIQFDSQSADAEQIIESLAYRELTRYAASADIGDLLASGGIKAAELIKERLQKACDAAGYNGDGLGVEIVYVGLGGIHPPQADDVAKSYEEVVSAIEMKDSKILAARGDAASDRIMAAGLQWEKIYNAIEAESAASNAGAPDLAEKTAEVERLLRTVAGGDARAIAMHAEQTAYGRLFAEKSASERYSMQLTAYNAAPSVYMLRVYLRMISNSIWDARKFIIALEDASRLIYEVDLKPPEAVDILGAEIRAVEQKNKR